MKKILIIISLLLIHFVFLKNISWGSCTYWWGDIWSALEWCLSDSPLVNWSKADIDNWFWETIRNWINNISVYLWVIAVWSIVYWSLMMTLSTWEDEKLSKAKKIVYWWMIWFVWLISVSAIINLVTNIMYSL